MNGEELVESGYVVESKDGFAEIILKESDNCEECSAKLFCKPKSGKSKTIKAIDPYNALPGDEVKISIKGKTLFNASFLLYGIPIILLLLGIVGGLKLFSSSSSPELFSFLIGLFAMSAYYFIFYLIISNKKKDILPKIIFIKRITESH